MFGMFGIGIVEAMIVGCLTLIVPVIVVIAIVSAGSQRRRDAANPNLALCPDCGRHVSRNAATCPQCGCPLSTE